MAAAAIRVLAVLLILFPVAAPAETAVKVVPGAKPGVAGQARPRLAKADVKSIPIGDAIRIGGPKSKKNVVVFSDPDCHFCAKLHSEIKAVVAGDPDVAFHVKIYARNGNPATARKAAAVVCSKSERMLDDAYARKVLPEPACETKSVEETAKLAAQLTLGGTPVMILPDGRIVRGYRDAAKIRMLLSESVQREGTPAVKGP
jgi:thiol:disulfide interchange protein DsbC